ncbi:WD40-repeat-containing domain protein [Gymnopilus junonius]|uniref:WD40-repeat-containing domain protein n=1 Tax=Gymnopilus junonius TaxID=109634 RepID=A0A9P5THM8_GYMJU|nr:WD40-repeat-containing domain protein [Gymnopilus junonius]
MDERHRLLLESPHLQEEKSPRRSSKSSTSTGYILSITSLPACYAASTSSPFNVIDLFDKNTLQGIQTLEGHKDATTSIRTAVNLGGVVQKCLISSGRDGSIKAWDERTNSHSIKTLGYLTTHIKRFTTVTNLGKTQPLLCCDVSPDGLTVAAGTDLQGEEASILYWDPRQPATPLRAHTSTHSDDITTLSFASSKDPETNNNILLSGSTDGLLCTSNADEDDEDEATIQVGNWGCSVSQAGWIQGCPNLDSAAIWAASDMETFSTWQSDLDQLLSLDIRSPVLHQRRTWVTDYLITTHSSSHCYPNPTIFTGSNEGDIAMLSNMNVSVPDAPWGLHKLWTHGHTGVVRSLLWDEENQILVTGGEDGKINSWPIYPVPRDSDETVNDNEDEDEDEAMDVDVSSPKSRKRDLQRDSKRNGKKAKRW